MDTIKVIGILYEFRADIENMSMPDISENNKSDVSAALANAIELLRTHALPLDHSLAVE